MKCPKCGFVSHEYLDACLKCSIDLVDFKAQMNLYVVQPTGIDLMAALEGAAVSLKTNAADMFSTQMLVQSDENLDESGDNFDISLDDDFSAFDPEQLERARSGQPATSGVDDSFHSSEHGQPGQQENDPAAPPPTTGYATVMIDVSAMDSMFDDEDNTSTATAQSEASPAAPEPPTPEPTLGPADTISPNTAMLHLEDTSDADTSDPHTTVSDAIDGLDVPVLEDVASVEPDEATIAKEVESTTPSKDIALPHTAERTLVLGDLDNFGATAEIDSIDDVSVSSDSANADAEQDTIFEVQIPNTPMPSTAALTPTEIDLEPDEASAANPTASLEMPDTTSDPELDLSELDFDIEPELVNLESEQTDDLELNFMSTDLPHPPMPATQDEDDMTLELDDIDFDDDEKESS